MLTLSLTLEGVVIPGNIRCQIEPETRHREHTDVLGLVAARAEP